MEDRTALGRHGEDVAARHLQRLGLVVVARNWRCTVGDVKGEVDLVARDGTVLVFCEVKTRRGRGSGGPLAAVDWRKQLRLRSLAAAYLAEAGCSAEEIRFDVVGVTWDGSRAVLEHVRGAFL